MSNGRVEAAGAVLRYLPPYSPDLNPIEQVFSKLKAAAAQQLLPLRYLGPDDYRAELLALKAGYERLWREHPWRE